MDVKLKSSSHLFKKWVMQMDDILSKTHTHNQAGVPTTQDTDEIECRTYEQDLEKTDGRNRR